MASRNRFEEEFSFLISLHTPHANALCKCTDVHTDTHKHTPLRKTHTFPFVGCLLLWLRTYKSQPEEREGALDLCLRNKGAMGVCVCVCVSVCGCVCVCVCLRERFKGYCRAINPPVLPENKGQTFINLFVQASMLPSPLDCIQPHTHKHHCTTSNYYDNLPVHCVRTCVCDLEAAPYGNTWKMSVFTVYLLLMWTQINNDFCVCVCPRQCMSCFRGSWCCTKSSQEGRMFPCYGVSGSRLACSQAKPVAAGRRAAQHRDPVTISSITGQERRRPDEQNFLSTQRW